MLELVEALFRPFMAAVTIESLALLSFLEAIFFPIPPDTLLMPLVLQNPDQALLLALVAALASVAGAVVGYFIGLRGGRPVLLRFTSSEKIARVEALYQRYDMWSIFIAGFTPIPYKVFAVGAGVFRLSFHRFILASLAGRFARFGLEALLVAAYGAQMVTFIESHFEKLTLAGVAGALILWWGWRRMANRRS